MVRMLIIIFALSSSVFLFGGCQADGENHTSNSSDATKNATSYINDNTSANTGRATTPERPTDRQNTGLPSGPPSDTNALQMNAQF
jgi:hypothetical protein